MDKAVMTILRAFVCNAADKWGRSQGRLAIADHMEMALSADKVPSRGVFGAPEITERSASAT
jgi:hypothetical protein